MKFFPLLLLLLLLFSLFIATDLYADDFLEKTSACRMEVKILGPDVLAEDENCLWLEEHKSQVVKTCKDCLADLKLIKEASQGYFDY